MEIYGFDHANTSNQVHRAWPIETIWLEQLFFYFLIKTDFSRFWLNILYQKIKNFKKWEKMNFDSIFELAIVILVGLEYLIVKIGRKFWFLQLFFLGSFLLLYYR